MSTPGSHEDHDHSPAATEHAHGHSHNHGAGASRGRLLIALCLSVTVLVAEIITALLTGSLALLADAGHMLTDVVGLVMALVAAHLSTRPATDRSTWGMRRAEVIGAALQAGMLAVVGVFVAFKAIHNLLVAPQVEASGMLVMGVIGLVANIIALVVLSGGRGGDGHGENLNMRAAFLEVLNDALGSVGVIIAAAIVARTGWTRADAVVSLLIAVLILPRAVALLRSALAVLMDFTPKELDLAQVRTHMLEVDHVEEVHDLHAWTVASGMPVLTAHVVVRDECLRDGHTEEILDRLQSCMAEHFPVRIQHATLQLEPVSHLEHEAAHC
ncbi:cation transporter [Actinomyces johnsonii]|uniref:Cation transporter n=2 Tax=Actinomyces johnsonii TaxID=544581 RepID=A0A508AD31_9ACTO|nr:cation diffusion facilitator family transporter [Actinomyces johnsonii]ERH23728.1 putative cadmium, cobalt and zinc/H(+)-K(+) antiporter [Actinomyces johnsonii F0510]KAA8741101.1 cation transporter [Actinomyces johnsonii]TQD44965.1 cation transporter [Actinomyces johnsonii]